MLKLIKFTCFLALLFSGGNSFAQVEFGVSLDPDGVTYHVFLRPDQTLTTPTNLISTAQVTFKVPAGGFDIMTSSDFLPSGDVFASTSWNVSIIRSPQEEPNYDYFAFGLQNSTMAIPFTANQQVELFTLRRTGVCTGPLLFMEAGDPFENNSLSLNFGNSIVVSGYGQGESQNGFFGEDANNCFDCTTWEATEQAMSQTELTISNLGESVTLSQDNPTSALTYSWTPNDGTLSCLDCPMPIATPTMTTTYNVMIEYVNKCILIDAITLQMPNLPPTILNTDTYVNPAGCDCNDGSGAAVGAISITASPHPSNSVQSLEYQLDSGAWQSSNAFVNVSIGAHTINVRHTGSNPDSYATQTIMIIEP